MSEEESQNILVVAHGLFAYMRENDVDIPIAMGAFAAALSLMAAKLHVEQPDLLKSFKQTMEIVYADYAEDKEANTH
jgi:hypothetical protein